MGNVSGRRKCRNFDATLSAKFTKELISNFDLLLDNYLMARLYKDRITAMDIDGIAKYINHLIDIHFRSVQPDVVADARKSFLAEHGVSTSAEILSQMEDPRPEG